MRKDGKQCPRDGNAGRQVALLGGEGIASCSSLEEEQCQEHKDLRPDTSGFCEGVHAESLKGREDDKNSRPPVPQGEGDVDKEIIRHFRRDVVFFDDVIDVGDCGGNEQREDKGKNVVLVGPQVDINGVENNEKRETPGDGVHDNDFPVREELVNDCS